MGEVIEKLNPKDDGITHINIYTRGATRLGRLLTNLSDVSVEHPKYGQFRTLEGLWYYLKTGCQHESLRACAGFQAKQMGRELPVIWFDGFQDEIKLAVRCKIEGRPELQQLFVESTLPFEHYYFYGNNRSGAEVKVIEPKDVRWLTEYFTELREEMKLRQEL